MSNLIVPDVSENNLQTLWLGGVSSTLNVSLFRTNVTPGSASVFTDFVKANFTGYADVTVTMGAPGTVGGKSITTATAAAQFVMGVPGTGNTVYGYYVWIPATSILLWAEAFDNPFIMANHLDEIDITLVFSLFSQF